MDPNLIIDDEYVYAVGNNCYRRGKKLEDILEQYATILSEIQGESLVEGKISEALGEFIQCISLLKGELGELSKSIDDRTSSFIQDVNDADQYLF